MNRTSDTKILIVEDEEQLARFIELELLHEGYEVDKIVNGLDAVAAICGGGYDLVLLDVMLPGINGMEVLRRVIESGCRVPVIFLTARDSVMDKVAGLDAGAVDYITKPFAIEELLARIRAALKRRGESGAAKAEKGEVLCWKELKLDKLSMRVFYGEDEIVLTNREFLMLQTLLENHDIVMSRDTLMSKVCGYDYAGETNIIDVYVRYLRSKIDEVYGVKMIRTVRGAGYVINSEET